MLPQLFHFGKFFLPTYGVLVALGVLVGLWVSVKNSERQGIDPDDAWNLGITMVLSGILGAKVLYILVDLDRYRANPGEIFSVATLQSGGVFSGGLVAALLAAAWFMRKHRMPALATCDAFAPGLALGHAFGRVGCFAAGCCYGKPTSHFWGVTFANPMAEALVGTPLHQALQPTQLIECAVELANFFLLMWLFKRRKFSGQVFATYLIVYGIARFFIEFLRGDPGRGSVFGDIMSGTQLISICLVIVGGIVWYARSGVIKPAPAHAVR